MRTETITRTIYTYDELSDAAKEVARDWWREGEPSHEWWDITYEDAARIGLKITSFDLDRNKHAKGDFQEGPLQIAENVLKEHGEGCETHKTAEAFLRLYKPMIEKLDELEARDEPYDNILENHQELMSETVDAFEKELLHDYATMLQNECDYILSDEAVEESIIANEYEFLETGKRA